MFIYTAKFSKRRAFSLLFLLAALAAAAALFLRGGKTPDAASLPSGATDRERVEYLASLGWQVNAEPIETLTLTLPDPLEEPYLSYNMLQQEQGFDLVPYVGKTLQRCTYTVTNHPNGCACQSNLYIYKGQIVAGDIVCTGENGFISTLRFPGGSGKE